MSHVSAICTRTSFTIPIKNRFIWNNTIFLIQITSFILEINEDYTSKSVKGWYTRMGPHSINSSRPSDADMCQLHRPSLIQIMVLLPDTQNCGLRLRRECRERFPRHRRQRKPLVNDPGMHRNTCVTHVPWCMSGSLTRGGGKTFPAFPAHVQPAILRIWQEAHGLSPFRHQAII